MVYSAFIPVQLTMLLLAMVREIISPANSPQRHEKYRVDDDQGYEGQREGNDFCGQDKGYVFVELHVAFVRRNNRVTSDHVPQDDCRGV